MKRSNRAYEDDDNKDFLLIFLPKIKIPWKWQKVRVLTRALQAAMGFVILLLVSAVSFKAIENANYLFNTDSYKFLIANGVLIWVYATSILLVKLESVHSQIPPQVCEYFDGKEDMVQLAGDVIFSIFCFSGGLAALDALYTSACGGSFPLDECFSLEDICKMALRNNSRYEGWSCPIGNLKAAAIMTFLMMPLLALSFKCAWRSFRGSDVHEPLTEGYNDEVFHDGDPSMELRETQGEESWSMIKNRQEDLSSEEHADIYRAQGLARDDEKGESKKNETSLMQEVDTNPERYEDV